MAMKAKHESDCPACGQKIYPGDGMVKDEHDRWVHEVCPGEHSPEESTSTDEASEGGETPMDESTHKEHVPSTEEHSDDTDASAEEHSDDTETSEDEAPATATSAIDKEIEAAMAAARKRVEALKRKRARAQAEEDRAVLAMLKAEHADLHAKLVMRAQAKLEQVRAERSAKARASRKSA